MVQISQIVYSCCGYPIWLVEVVLLPLNLDVLICTVCIHMYPCALWGPVGVIKEAYCLYISAATMRPLTEPLSFFMIPDESNLQQFSCKTCAVSLQETGYLFLMVYFTLLTSCLKRQFSGKAPFETGKK